MNFFGLKTEAFDLSSYIFGSSQIPVVQFRQDADWRPWVPRYENQTTKLGQETSGCTAWGLLNQIEILEKYRYGEEPNYSERFVHRLVPIDPATGTDPHRTYETVRRNGLVSERSLPMTRTLDEYLDTSAITPQLRARGQRWLETYDFRHEWLWRGQPANRKTILKQALKTGPIGISVSAWTEQNGFYVSSTPNNHWCVLLYIGEHNGLQDAYCVLDSYDHHIKWLHPDHQIDRAKRIWIQKRTPTAMRKDVITLRSVVDMLTSLLPKKKTILDYAEERLGTDVSPRDLAADELGCAESMTNLMKLAHPETPILTGTWSLYDYLNNPRNGYVKTIFPKPGTIIISYTVPGRPFPGHVGIFMRDMTIASNDSATGRFVSNYTLETWRERWFTRGGYQIHLYDRK